MLVLVVAVAVSAGAAVLAQERPSEERKAGPPGAGRSPEGSRPAWRVGRPGPGRRPHGRHSGGFGLMERLMENVVVGRITDLNPVKGYVQVRTMPTGTSRIVIIGEDTELEKLDEGTSEDLAVGEEVTVSGIPLQLRAEGIRVGAPWGLRELMAKARAASAAAQQKSTESETTKLATEKKAGSNPEEGEPKPETAKEEAEREAEGQQPTPEAEQEAGPKAVEVPHFRRPPTTKVTGIVKSLQPLVLQISDTLTVTIDAAAETKIERVVAADLGDLRMGQPIVAFGVPDPDNYLQATEVRVGEALDFGALAGSLAGMGMPF